MVPAQVLPPFLPNLYDLYIMLNGDPVIVCDVHIFSRKSRIHRGRIRTPNGDDQWLTLPIRKEDRKKRIPDVRLDNSVNWPKEWMKQLRFCYSASTYFDHFEEQLYADFQSAATKTYLTDATFVLYDRIRRYLEIPEISLTPASELSEWDDDPDQLAHNLGAGHIFQEHRSRHYLRQAECRIDPEITFPQYHQKGEGFVPWCCWIDLIFEYGPESFKIIDQLYNGVRGKVTK